MSTLAILIGVFVIVVIITLALATDWFAAFFSFLGDCLEAICEADWSD